jgi:hypothetical protein
MPCSNIGFAVIIKPKTSGIRLLYFFIVVVIVPAVTCW